MRCDCCGGSGWTPLFSENSIRLGQCPDCDLLSIEDIPQPELRMTEMEEGHFAGSREILAARRQIASERILEKRFAGYVDLATAHVDGGRWLDVGCGSGLLLSLAARAGFEVDGIELNADRRVVAAEVSGAEIHGQPVEELGFPDASFDVISLINVFSHITSPAATLAELRRILRPGGVIVMATGEMVGHAEPHHMLDWNLGDHLHFLGERTMARYGERLGLEIRHHDRRWLPDEMFSAEWLRIRGRSRAKNAVKTAIRFTPGGLGLLRAVMLRRQAGSAAHASVFVLAAR